MLNPKIIPGSVSENKIFENRVTQTFKWMTAEFEKNLLEKVAEVKEKLLGEYPNLETKEKYSDLGTETAGVQYDDNLKLSGKAVNLYNIFTEGFTRNVHNLLVQEIDGIKEDDKTNKEEVHSFFLNKYLGVDFKNEFSVVSASNAFNSIPIPGREDETIHLYFLQPFRFFGVEPEDRKVIRKKNEKPDNREWVLLDDERTDLASLFRAYIQLLLISVILEDYAMEKNPYYCEDIADHMDDVKRIEQELKTHIEEKLNLFWSVIAENHKHQVKLKQDLQGERRGLIYYFPKIKRLEEWLIPGAISIANFYPIGRLIYGQPPIAEHEILANNQVREEALSFWRRIKFSFYWFFAHLNLSTSLFWTRLCLERMSTWYASFKAYITNVEPSFINFAVNSLRTIPLFFLFTAAPILIFFPWAYGLTSLPFSLLRAFCVHGSIHYFRDYKFLKMLDVIEFMKDVFLFFWVILPIFNTLLALITSLMPVSLISAGMIVSHLVLSSIYFSTVHGIDHSSEHIFSIVDTYFFRFLNSGLLIGMGGYLAVGMIGRQLYLQMSPSFKLGVRFNLSKQEIERRGIIPDGREPALEVPKRLPYIMSSQVEEDERTMLHKKLSQIVRSNLDADQIRMINNCAAKMENSRSIEEVKKEMKRASDIFEVTYSQEEIDELMRKLDEKYKSLLENDIKAMEEAKNGQNHFYLPSLAAERELKKRGLLSDEQQVLLPSPRGLSSSSSS